MTNSDSILDSVKKDLGISAEYTHFDPDVIMGINSAFSILNQLGIGPENGVKIIDDTSTWSDFLGNDSRLEFVKSYVSKKTKQFFDPPQTGPLATALDNTLKEIGELLISRGADINAKDIDYPNRKLIYLIKII